MSQEIQPPDSLINILPDLKLTIASREIERQRNLLANEAYLQARGILTSELAQSVKPNELNGNKIEYRATPRVDIIKDTQGASLELREDIYSNPEGEERNFGAISIIIRLGEVAEENLQLFNLRQGGNDNSDPILKTERHIYEVKNYKGRNASVKEIEMLIETLTFIQQSLNL